MGSSDGGFPAENTSKCCILGFLTRLTSKTSETASPEMLFDQLSFAGKQPNNFILA